MGYTDHSFLSSALFCATCTGVLLSTSRSLDYLFQVLFFGRPLPLKPCGIHWSACLAIGVPKSSPLSLSFLVKHCLLFSISSQLRVTEHAADHKFLNLRLQSSDMPCYQYLITIVINFSDSVDCLCFLPVKLLYDEDVTMKVSWDEVIFDLVSSF